MNTEVALDQDGLMAWLRDCISTTCQMPIETIGLDEDFEQFGVDSVSAVSIVMELEEALGLDADLPPELLFECRTIRNIACHVHGLWTRAKEVA